MNKIKSLTILLLATSTLCFSMQQYDQAEIERTSYIATKMNVELLEKKRDAGDHGSALALIDFYKSLQDPKYVISFEPARKQLVKFAILNRLDNQVDDATRQAFKKYEPSK